MSPRRPSPRGSGSPRRLRQAGPTEQRRLATICVPNRRSLLPREPAVGLSIVQPPPRHLGPCELGMPESRMKNIARVQMLTAEVLEDSDFPVVL
eukprot:4338598-Pyramimonas_sp.AAC.1